MNFSALCGPLDRIFCVIDLGTRQVIKSISDCRTEVKAVVSVHGAMIRESSGRSVNFPGARPASKELTCPMIHARSKDAISPVRVVAGVLCTTDAGRGGAIRI